VLGVSKKTGKPRKPKKLKKPNRKKNRLNRLNFWKNRPGGGGVCFFLKKTKPKKKPLNPTNFFKKPAGSVRFRFYQQKTEKTEPNRKWSPLTCVVQYWLVYSFCCSPWELRRMIASFQNCDNFCFLHLIRKHT
jgi:hypothetical protein